MSKITKSAQNEECQIRIPTICNGDPATTVFAHLSGGGMGGKVGDLHGSYSCSDCHAEVDRVTQHIDYHMASLYHHEGSQRTLALLSSKGLIKI